MNLPAKARNWSLMANYADKSLMRNAVASKISEIIGLEFSPAEKFVDVVLNGEYIGNYTVSDHKDVREFRVDVEEQDATITALPYLSGGYLIEIDGFAGGRSRPWFRTNQGMPVSIRYPDNEFGPKVNPEQIKYITDFTQRFENALFSSTFKDPDLGYRALVDTTSLINWYIGSELTGNSDAFWSTYLYKRRNIDKFFFGPMWDYDIAFNNDYRLGEATEKMMRDHAHHPRTWIQQLWKDEWFRNAVYRRWMQLVENEQIIAKLNGFIDETATLIDESQKQNFQRWNILSYRVYLEQVLFNTYNEYVTYLKSYLKRRSEFLTRSFTSDKPEDPPAPFVVEDFYYMILNVRTNNAIQVQNQSNDVNANLDLWAPQEGNNYQQWMILPLDGKKFQIINRNTGLAITGNGRGTNLIQTNPDSTNAAQLWTINPVLTGNIYGIINQKSKYSINNSGGSSQNGTAVIEYDERITESKNQQWYFRKTEQIEETAIRQPATNRLFVYVSGDVLHVNNLTGNNVISIYTLSGQLVSTVKTGDAQFNCTLNQGSYILTVRGENNHSKIIIAK